MRKTAAAQPRAPRLLAKEKLGDVARWSGQRTQSPATMALGMTSLRKSSATAAAINPVKPAMERRLKANAIGEIVSAVIEQLAAMLMPNS
jgi:hypothetical protein